MYMGGGWADYKIFQYSWRRGAWSTLPECPVRWFGLIQFMGRLTTVGGVDPAESKTGHVYQLIAESQQWQESLPPMPTARSIATVVAHPSSSSKPPAFVACGGRGDDGVVLNTVEVFYHYTLQWHTAEPLPTPLYGLTSTTIGNTTYFLGGTDSSRSATKQCFSVFLDSLIGNTLRGVSLSQHGSLWMEVKDTKLTESSAASLRGSLVAIGGKDSRNSPSVAIHLLTSKGSWKRMKRGDLLEPCCLCTAVCLPSGELMVTGGSYNFKGPQPGLFITNCD